MLVEQEEMQHNVSEIQNIVVVMVEHLMVVLAQVEVVELEIQQQEIMVQIVQMEQVVLVVLHRLIMVVLVVLGQ